MLTGKIVAAGAAGWEAPCRLALLRRSLSARSWSASTSPFMSVLSTCCCCLGAEGTLEMSRELVRVSAFNAYKEINRREGGREDQQMRDEMGSCQLLLLVTYLVDGQPGDV